MSRTNETWHETCKCKCRLYASICNNKQRQNEDKYGRECKKLIDKGICDKAFIWNSSNCECECNKSFDIGRQLDYENYKCRKKLFDKIVQECIESIGEVEINEVTQAENQHKNKYSSCVNCVIFNILYNQYRNYYLFCLLLLILKKTYLMC